ncbi:hypothetical protein BDZ97DRAFT_943617 [Flammula alnicola]|nr:hypothetical protein BDZ97DRAFT_943617 [Flammula alnicola]
MVLKAEVVEAFAALGITTDTDQVTATKAYKRLALIHHPDRNHGDPTATQRFQQIGAAWNICQRHFDNPSWSHVPEPSATGTKHTHGFTYSFSKDDDIPLDEDELREFYMFMFAETLFNRYSRAKGQRYRYERSGHAGAGVSTFSGGFAESQERQARNAERQMREKEEYEKRKRELELEIEEEERERERIAKKLKADEDRQVTALEHAFQAALAGNSSGVQKSVLDYDLDVSAPRKRGKQTRKQDDVLHHDTLLHAAASHCDETLVMFLIERGAKPTTLNKNKLTPFHAAIQAGNTRVVRFIMERRGKSFEGYHPSKAAPSGRTPLQLAIESRVPAMVELLVKDATTHDVERCWKSETMSEEIREILRSKDLFHLKRWSIRIQHLFCRKNPFANKRSHSKKRRESQRSRSVLRLTVRKKRPGRRNEPKRTVNKLPHKKRHGERQRWNISDWKIIVEHRRKCVRKRCF